MCVYVHELVCMCVYMCRTCVHIIQNIKNVHIKKRSREILNVGTFYRINIHILTTDSLVQSV